MTVDIHGNGNRRVAHSLLDDLCRQFQPAVSLAVDAPRGEEVAQHVQAGILRGEYGFSLVVNNGFPVRVFDYFRYTGRDLCWGEHAVNDVGVAFNVAGSIREDERNPPTAPSRLIPSSSIQFFGLPVDRINNSR